jgi:hypothetical protein
LVSGYRKTASATALITHTSTAMARTVESPDFLRAVETIASVAEKVEMLKRGQAARDHHDCDRAQSETPLMESILLRDSSVSQTWFISQ